MENVSKLVICVAHVANLIGKTVEDKKVDMSDLVNLIPLIKEVQELAGIDYKTLSVEFKAYSPAQMALVRDAFKAEFDLPQDKVEALVEQAFAIAIMLLDAYQALKAAKA